MPQGSLTAKIHTWSKRLSKSWENKVLKVFNHYELTGLLNRMDRSTSWITDNINRHLKELDAESWLEKVQSLPNLRTYKTFKSSLKTEAYLSLPRFKRSILASLRCGSLKLEIETGRYSTPPTPADQRLCKYCSLSCIENEKHFLLHCPLYEDIRLSLLSELF